MVSRRNRPSFPAPALIYICLNAGTYVLKFYVSLLDGANPYTEIFNSNGLTWSK
jgi:hypothetical protein